MEISAEQKLYSEVVEKAWEDADFKKKLITNPIAAIEEVAGQKIEIPEGKSIVVRDQSAEDVVYVNIPPLPEADVELNENELEKVAGGCQWGDSGRGGGIWNKPKPFEMIRI